MMRAAEIEKLLRPWQRKLFPGAQYSYASLQFTLAKTITFEAGSPSEVVDRSLSARAAGDNGQLVRFHSASIDDVEPTMRRAKMCLALAERDRKTPAIKVPQHKVDSRPDAFWDTDEFVGRKSNIADWDMPANLMRDLKRASRVSVDGLSPIVALHLESDSSWFLDSTGFRARWSNPTMLVEVRLPTYTGNEAKRFVGFSPTNEDELPRIYELIKYVQDVTPDSRLRRAGDFSDLTTRLGKSVVAWKNGSPAKIQTRAVPIVTHMVTPAHELVGHFFEEPVEMERSKDEDPFVECAPYFSENSRVGRPDLTVGDDPAASLHNLHLVGTTPIDMEGFPTKPRRHISHGIVGDGTLGSRYSTRKNFGNAFTTGRMPQPRMTVTKTSPADKGPETIEELLNAAGVDDAVVGIWDHGFADYIGLSALGASEDPISGRAAHPKAAEVWLAHKEKGGFSYAPIRTPLIVTVQPLLGLKYVLLGGPHTLGYDPANCYCTNPVGGMDKVKSSQVGPLAVMYGAVVRAYDLSPPRFGFAARRGT